MTSPKAQVKWYRSLTFKLFVLVSSLLFMAIGTVSLQHGKLFAEMLSKQNTDSLLSSNQMAASSFHDHALFWLSTGTSLGHLASSSVDDSITASVAESMLASNRSMAAVQIIETQPKRREILLKATSYNAPEMKGHTQGEIQKAVAESLQNILLSDKSVAESPIFVKNIYGTNSLPIVHLGTKITSGNNSSAGKNATRELWVVVSIWSSGLTTGLSQNDVFTSAILDNAGAVLLSQTQDKSSSLFSKVSDAELRPILEGKVAFNTYNSQTPKGEPLLSSITKIDTLNLFAISQKKVGAEQMEIQRQVQQILLWAWILFLIAIAVSYVTSHNITRRLAELVKLTAQIAGGNFSVRLEITSQDEVGELSLAVNKMAADVQSFMEMRETAARQQTELKMAERIQQLLIPPTCVHRNGMKTMSYFKPANECAGDWWGRFSFGEGLELVGIGDATGHGVQSALIAALVHSYFATVEEKVRAGVKLSLSPRDLLIGLNEVMFDSGKGESTLTLCLMLFDLKSQKLHVASAGHCAPFVCTASKVKNIVTGGSVIGMGSQGEFHETTVSLDPGSRYFMYTDGLIECENEYKDIIKKKVIQKVLASQVEMPFEQNVEYVFSEVEKFFGDYPLTDDITLVMVEASEEALEGAA